MRVKVIDACLYKGEHQEPGTILDVSDEDGATIISSGRGRKLDEDDDDGETKGKPKPKPVLKA